MNKILILALLCATVLTLHLQSLAPMRGGYYTIDPNPKIDNFIRTQFPELANAKLIKA